MIVVVADFAVMRDYGDGDCGLVNPYQNPDIDLDLTIERFIKINVHRYYY
jgi:hypothetical protein